MFCVESIIYAICFINFIERICKFFFFLKLAFLYLMKKNDEFSLQQELGLLYGPLSLQLRIRKGSLGFC